MYEGIPTSGVRTAWATSSLTAWLIAGAVPSPIEVLIAPVSCASAGQ